MRTSAPTPRQPLRGDTLSSICLPLLSLTKCHRKASDSSRFGGRNLNSTLDAFNEANSSASGSNLNVCRQGGTRFGNQSSMAIPEESWGILGPHRIKALSCVPVLKIRTWFASSSSTIPLTVASRSKSASLSARSWISALMSTSLRVHPSIVIEPSGALHQGQRPTVLPAHLVSHCRANKLRWANHFGSLFCCAWPRVAATSRRRAEQAHKPNSFHGYPRRTN